MPLDPIALVLVKFAAQKALAFIAAELIRPEKLPPLRAACQRVADQFQYEGVALSLEAWARDPEVIAVLMRLQEGHDPTDGDIAALIGHFREAGFYAGDTTDREASAVLGRFFNVLQEELLVSDRGHIYQTNRIIAVVQGSENRVVASFAQLAEQLRPLLEGATALALPAASVTGDGPDYAMARKLLQRRKPGAAQSVLDVIAVDSVSADQDYEWRALSGHCALQQGDVEGAVDRFRSALAVNPGRAPAHSNLAQALLLSGDRASARASTVAALAIDPIDQGAILVSAQLEATDDLSKGLALAGRISDVAQRSYVMGVILKRAGHFEECVKHLDAAVAAGLEQTDLLMRLAEARLELAIRGARGRRPAVWALESSGMGNALRDAEALATRALELLPVPHNPVEGAQIRAFRAHVRAFGDLEGVEDDVAAAIPYASADPMIAVPIARALLALAKPASATDVLQRHLEAGSRDPDAVRLFAQIMGDTGREREGHQLVDTLGLGDVLGQPGRALLGAKVLAGNYDYDGALALLEALPSEGQAVDVPIMVGRIHIMAGRPAAAREALSGALGRDGGGGDWKLNLWIARSHLSEDNPSAGAETLAPLIGPNAPEELVLMYLRGLVDADRAGTAVTEAERYLEAQPRAREVRVALATALGYLGHLEAAVQHYEDALDGA